MAARKDLGALLLEENLITSADLERARKAVRERGGRLLSHLCAAGLDEQRVYDFLRQRLGIAAIPEERLADVNVPPELRRAVPRELATETAIVPLEMSSDRRTLSVAASDPTDEVALEAVRRAAAVDAVRAYLGKRGTVLQVIEREYGTPTPVGEASPKIEIDPELAREIEALEKQNQGAPSSERTPTLKVVPPPSAAAKPKTPPPVTAPKQADVQLPLDVVHRAASEAAASRVRTQPPKNADTETADDDAPTPMPVVPGEDRDTEKTQVRRITRPGRVDEDARTPIPEIMRAADERHNQVLTQTIGLLVDLAETHIVGSNKAREMGRFARRIAREMGLAERAIAEIGLAAELYSLDRAMREVGEDPPDFVATFGWAAGAPDGLAPMLRVLVDPDLSARTPPSGIPAGARVVKAVEDVLKLRAETGGPPDPERLAEVLQAHHTTIDIVEAIFRVLSAERAARAAKAQPVGSGAKGGSAGHVLPTESIKKRDG